MPNEVRDFRKEWSDGFGMLTLVYIMMNFTNVSSSLQPRCSGTLTAVHFHLVSHTTIDMLGKNDYP